MRTIQEAKSDIEKGENLGLWLRGLIPTGMLPVIDKSILKTRTTGNSEARHTATEFYSDGTLGHYAQFPNLAVGGWGWCALHDDNSVIGAECGTLEGDE